MTSFIFLSLTAILYAGCDFCWHDKSQSVVYDIVDNNNSISNSIQQTSCLITYNIEYRVHIAVVHTYVVGDLLCHTSSTKKCISSRAFCNFLLNLLDLAAPTCISAS